MDWLIPLAVLVTATLSGVFGMAGGMLLIAILALVLPVEAALLFHGAVQLTSNGSRFWLHRRHLQRRSLVPYFLGCGAAVALCWTLGVQPDRATLFVSLGLVTLLGLLLPPSRAPEFSQPGAAASCGLAVTAAQLTAGVSGPLLDFFFLRGPTLRRGVLATKALTQCVGHAIKILWFGLALENSDQIPPAWVWIASLTLAVCGSAIGRSIVLRLDERVFRRYSRMIVTTLAVVCLAQGIHLMS